MFTLDAELIVLPIGTENLSASSDFKTKLAIPNMPHKSQAATTKKMYPTMRRSDPVLPAPVSIGRVLAHCQIDPRKNNVIRPPPTPKSAGIMWSVVPAIRQAVKSTSNRISSQNTRRSTLAVRAAPMATMNAPSGTDSAQIKPNIYSPPMMNITHPIICDVDVLLFMTHSFFPQASPFRWHCMTQDKEKNHIRMWFRDRQICSSTAVVRSASSPELFQSPVPAC